MCKLWRILPLLFSGALGCNPAFAQIKTDGTLGRVPQTLLGPDYAIGPELGRIKGQNLFHSFERFNLHTQADGTVERATFSGPAGIKNIISRVTGNAPSSIDGTIASEIAGADLYFINPAGIVFGQNAHLDLGGSFHASTADEVRFGDHTTFSASHPTSALTIADPEAFGFLGAAPRGIRVNDALLEAPAGEVLSLVGGEVAVDASFLVAPGGAIDLVALGGPGEVRMDGEAVTGRRAGIAIRGQAILSTTGDGGGTIRIRAGRFELTDGSALATNNSGATNSEGGIDIDASSVAVTSGASVQAAALGAGHAGSIRIDADRLTVDGDGSATIIESDVGRRKGTAHATGRGGQVIVRAGVVEIRDGGLIRSSTFREGAAGAVDVHAGQLLISGEGLSDPLLTGISGQVEQGATGRGGEVSVTARDLELHGEGVISSNTFSQGNAGDVTVEADQVTLDGGGQISSSTLRQAHGGRGGGVSVTAHEALSISGQGRRPDPDRGTLPPSGIFASTESLAADSGMAGNATVTAPVIEIADRGEISSESFGGGDSGKVTVTATHHLVVDAGEISTEAAGSGAAGAITVGAGKIELRNAASIHSDATGAGAAGSVTITADQLLSDRGEISTNSAAAGGGEIKLRVGEFIDLRDSEVTTSVQGGTDTKAGNITIDPDVLVIDHSRIQANANAPTGSGGNVRIEAGNILVPGGDFEALVGHDISASGGTPERAGTVTVNAPEVDLLGGLLVLQNGFVDTAPLRARCGARRDIDASSFTGVGRAGLPPSPDGPLAGAWLGADLAPAVPAAATLPEAGRSSVLVLPCAPRS